ncbi:hypothetical protein, partial [Modestobacter italicus]|uniref:hypothetical protein n=1 Tax=Modestobacter italicus (strain DSM 44449 / CECT 9708 / BC 501) TaxID=2732864 RepID=UPI001C975CD3
LQQLFENAKANAQAIDEIRNELTELTNLVVVLQQEDNFPSQPETIFQGQQSEEVFNDINNHQEQVKAIPTLRSEKFENFSLKDSPNESNVNPSDGDMPHDSNLNSAILEVNVVLEEKEWVPPRFEESTPPSFKEEFLSLTSKPPELEEIQMPYILKFAPSSKNEVFQRSRKGIHKDKVDEVVPNFLNEFSTLGNSIKKYLEKR